MRTYKYWRRLYEFTSDEPDLSPEAEYQYYLDNAIRTKDELLRAIKGGKKRYSDPDPDKRTRSEVFYSRLANLFDEFYVVVENKLLPEPLDDWWSYSISIRDTGITLSLGHQMMLYDEMGTGDDRYCFACDEEYVIAEKKAKLLTLEQYGELHGVGAGTVRQWIRRGKIRSASKFGTEWRVPELSDKPGRGYSSGHYQWHNDLPDPPEGIPVINDYDSLYLYQSTKDGTWFAKLECINKDAEIREYALSLKAKEKLELYLIGHPLVECINNFCGEIRQKRHYKED